MSVSHAGAGPERAQTVGELLRAARAALDAQDARIDSELLLAHVLGRSAQLPVFAHPEALVTAPQCAAYAR
jgi:hypothetical protein